MNTRRWIGSLLLAVSLLLGLVAGAEALPARWWVGVQDELGAAVTSGITCHVFTTNSTTTAPSIFTTRFLNVAATNPMASDSSGVCEWFADDVTASFDLLVSTNKGWGRVEGLTPTSQHRVIIDRGSGWKKIRFQVNAASLATDITTAFTLPRGAMVTYAVLESFTITSTRAFSVGNGTSVTAYCNATAISAAAGYYVCSPTIQASPSQQVVHYSHGFTGEGYITLHYVELSNR